MIMCCLQHIGNYWAHHLPPHVTGAFYDTVDSAINTAFLLATDINLLSFILVNLHRIQLPI